MLVSRSARSDCTTTSRRRPIVVVTICPAPINSYSFVRPKPVTSHASSIVQVSRCANGIVLGSAAFGVDRLTCDSCPPVFSRRLYLTWPSYSHKARQEQELIVRRQRQCEHPMALAYDSARQRRFEYFRIPKATRKLFANAPATVRHRAEASLLISAANSPSVRRCSPASYSTIIQRTRLMAT